MTENPKRFSNLQARAALAGIELRAVRNDAEQWAIYAISGPVTLEIPSLDQAERWLDSVAAPIAAEG